MDSAHMLYVKGCHSTQETRVHNALNDVRALSISPHLAPRHRPHRGVVQQVPPLPLLPPGR